MWLTDHAVSIKKEEQFGKYLSLFAMGGAVKNLTLQGVFYPLDHYLLEGMDPLCVSNEITEEACQDQLFGRGSVGDRVERLISLSKKVE